MFELIILAIALSMDAFAVSISIGTRPRLQLFPIAIKAAILFGFFQGAMPLIGYFLGKSTLGWLSIYSHWVAFALLAIIGGKMLYEAFAQGEEEQQKTLTNKVFVLLAIATSIDAAAAGFTLNLLAVSVTFSCLVIGLVTAIFSFAGVYIGKATGHWLEDKAEVLGGLMLIALALKMLIS